MSLFKKIRISRIREETGDCKTFILDTDDPGLLGYKPGQFLTFVFRGISGEERRSYSISSSPALGEPLAVTVKRVENGAYSRRLLDYARVGDELTVIGPTGFFTLPETPHPYKRLFFIAAGSGITPVYSLIKTVLYTRPELELVLIYSNRSKENTIFYEGLRELETAFAGRLTIEWLFSASSNLERARLSKWLLEILLKRHARVALPETLFYLCGPFDFMRMATIELLEDGAKATQIRKEYFSNLKPEIKAEPSDKERHLVHIRLADGIHTIETQYPHTILQSARKAGISLPYSCEAGRCGSCAATCTSGKVWMSYNEVLLDEEMVKGRVLTCVGYPIGGDATIEY
ncbi:MAG TPA: ferredoxin--NADP reductase [Chitinophagaceae bacterium]|jgi:ring-1,2-phenylacetyl-CoA epoxidase subunit PaaE